MRAHWIVAILLIFTASLPVRAETKSGLTVSSGITNLQANWFSGQGSLQRMLYVGAGFSLYGHYVHFDLDGYFGSAAIKNASQNEGAMDQYGGLVAFGGHLPLHAGRVLIEPKLGVGYGLMALSFSGTVSPVARFSLPLDSRQQLHGAFLVPGLAIEPWPWLILEVDYAFSLFAASERVGTVTGVAVNLPNQGAGFDRLRAGANFRIGKGFLLGLQFVQRTTQYGVFGNSGNITPVQQHYLGTVGLEF